MDAIIHQDDAIDYTKVEEVKKLKKNKLTVWANFLLFGWSYGALGRLGIQAVWYGIQLFTFYNIWITIQYSVFDEYSAGAVMGALIMVVWFIIRLFTINRDIRKYNDHIADHFYLTPDERIEAGID